MGSSNTFSKALKHMKGHKPSRLHEEVPTNNTQGLYRVEPNIVVMSHPGVDDPDFDQDGDGSSGYTGNDTSGLFMPDGTIRVAEPPGDTTAILGPMASMWYAWGNFSTFGYIRQSDRKMVNLGRITGKLSDWDGVSNFTSYNTGFTIDQAVWFRDVEKYGGISNDPAQANYRAFYPGPPSNTPDQYGRYYCTTTGRPKNRPTNTPPPNVPPDQAGYPWGPESNPENKPKKKKQGGEPELTPEGEEKLQNGEPLGIDDFKSAADFSAFANGGGNAAMNQKGQTPGEVMQQGRENIGDYDSGPRNPTPIFPDGNLPNNTPTPRKGQGGRELGDTTQRGGDTTQRGGDTRNNTPTPDAPPRKGQGGRELGDTTKRAGENQSQKQPMDKVPYNGGLENPNLLGRLFRSVTDGVRYAADKVVKGLPGAIEYNKDWKGGGKKLVDKLFGSPENAERILGSDWYKTDYTTPTSTLRRGELNVSRMYQSTDELTRGTPFGPKDGNYWIGDAPTQGKRGIKNPFGSTVSRGWSGTPEVQISTKGGGLPMTKATADDIAKFATAGSKTAKTLSRLVPIVSFSAGAADVTMRLKNNDIPGAVFGGISMIPGPAGYIGLGIQQMYDLERAGGTPRDPNQSDAGTSSPTSGLSGFERQSGKPQPDAYGGSGGGGLNFSRSQFDARQSAMRKSNRVSEAVEPKNNDKTKLIKYLKSQDKDQLIRQLIVALMSTGVPASVIKLVAKSAYGKKLTPDEEKFVKIALPKITKVLEQRRNSSNKKTRTESYKPLPRLPKRTNIDSSVNESHTLDVIRNIKKPVVIEEKKEKVKRRPRVIGSEPRTINSGMMKQAEVPASFKKPEDRMWGKYEQQQNARASQDRKNVVLDHLGNANDAWEYLLDRNAGKRSFAGYFEKDGTPRTIFTDGKVKTVTREEKVGSDTLIFFTDEEGKKGSILQSEYNDMQDQAHTQQMFAEYEATVAAAEEENSFDVIAHKLELKAEKNPTNDKIQSMLSSYRALSHLKKEDKKHEAHFVSWKSSIDGTIANNFQSWVDSVGQETADAVTKMALTEKMSSANLFGATLPATGDYDHIDMTFDSTYLDPDNDDIVNGAGSGSGYKGGFPVADGEQDVIQLTGHGEYSASAYTTDQDLTYVDTLSVTAIAGNGSNGGLTPINGLDVYFIGDDDFAGPFNVAPASQSSYANSQITIPEKMRTKNVSIYLYSDTSDYVNGMNFSGRHFGNQTFNVPGLDFTTIRNLFAYDDPGEENGEDFLSFYFTKRDRNNPDHMYSLGHYYWYNVQAQRLGLVDTERTGSEGGWWWAQWPSPPVNPSKTYGDSGNNYVGGPEDEDYRKIGEMIWDQFFGTKLWGISNISFKRKAPASVYVPLDSPEAINFMRTAPEMAGLTPAQRLKKLKEMLAAGNEYLIKMLGVSGSTATPDGYNTEVALDTIPYEEPSPGPGGYKPPGSYDPDKFYDLKTDPSQLPSPNLPSTGPGRSSVPDGTEVAASYPTTRTPLDKVGGWKGVPPGKGIYPRDKDGNLYNPQTGLPIKQASTSGGTEIAAGGNPRNTGGSSSGDPNNIQWPRNKYPNKKAPPGPGYRPPTAKKKQKTVVAHHEPKGKYLADSKTFKKQSFSKWYGSMESDTADKVISDAKIETKDQVLELVFDEFNRLRLQEGMTSKGFEYIYGLAVSNIVSQYGIDSKFASDLLHASADTTDYEFGPSFPGSYVNSIGDHQVDSSRKINVNAYYDSKFGSVSGSGGNFTLRTVDGPSGASVGQLNSALGITLPNGIEGALGGSPEEGSAVQRIFTGAKPGNIINFNWGFTSSEKGLDQDTKVDDYAFVAITGRVTKFVSILQGGDVRGGSFRYRLKPGDIDGNGNVKVAIGVVDVFDDIYNTTLRINSFGSLYAGDIGSIGDTTDAADLGAPVNNLDPKKKKKPSYMDIQVGDERVVKVDGETYVDTSTGYYNKNSGVKLTPAQMGKVATNVAGGTKINPSLQAVGSQGKGLGGKVKIGQHGTGPKAAKSIKKGGFKSGSRSNVYGTKGVFLDPSKSGAAADDFARAGAAAEAGGRTTTGRSAAQRAADLKAGRTGGKGVKIPVAYKPGTGSRMNIPGTKYAEVGVSADKATKGARLAQNAVTKYPNSAKAKQLIRTGATTAKVGAARGVASKLGKAVPIAGAAISIADAGYRASQGDYAGAALSGLTAVPGPVGWIALATQIATDAAGITGRSKKESYINMTYRGFVIESSEYKNYQEYVDRAKETIDKNNLKLDKNLLDVLKMELGLSDKLSDEDKEYLVDIFDNPDKLKSKEVSKFIKNIVPKLSSKN